MNATNLRQTDLGIEDLIKEMEASTENYPTCLIINEIGMICLSCEDNDGKGKEVLLSLLDHDDWTCRFSAFCAISCMPDLTQEETSLLESFRENPDNQHFLEKADEEIRKFKEEYPA